MIIELKCVPTCAIRFSGKRRPGEIGAVGRHNGGLQQTRLRLSYSKYMSGMIKFYAGSHGFSQLNAKLIPHASIFFSNILYITSTFGI